MKKRNGIWFLFGAMTILFLGFTLFPAGIRMTSITANRPLFINASGDITNASGTPDGTKFQRDDGVLAVPPGTGGGGTTNIGTASSQGLYDVRIGVFAPLTIGDTLRYAGGFYSNLWLNTPSAFTVTVTTTNVFVGTNLEQTVSIRTNASFPLIFVGTPLPGEVVNLTVSNYAAATIYITNSHVVYDVTVASNVTLFAVSSNSIRQFTFRNNTNFTAGANRWEMKDTLEKEAELAPGAGLSFSTNANSSVITINHNENLDAVLVTNGISYVTALRPGVGGALTNVTLFAGDGHRYINGFTNVSIRALMQYTNGIPSFPYYSITNISGQDNLIEFSAVTNRWHPSFQQGGALPTVLTNGTKLSLSMEVDGTNVTVSYSYCAWP